MKVENMTSSNGNKIANQFIISDKGKFVFQSCDYVIAERCLVNHVFHTRLDARYWNYSKTTSKYRNQFLGETTKETQAKIDSGEYILTDLNS